MSRTAVSLVIAMLLVSGCGGGGVAASSHPPVSSSSPGPRCDPRWSSSRTVCEVAPKRGVALAVPPVGMSGLSGDAYVAMWTLCGAVPVGRLVGQFGLAANTAAAVIAATASRRFIVGAYQDAGSQG